MQFDFTAIRPDAFRIDIIHAGNLDIKDREMVHEKVAPCLIIAQARVGQYRVECLNRKGCTEIGGAFLAKTGEPLKISHLGDPAEDFQMVAYWMHLSFKLWGTVDVTSLLEMPLIVSPAVGNQFGKIIDQLLSLRQQESFSSLIARQELAFSALRILVEVSKIDPHAVELLNNITRLQPVLDFIQANLHQSISIDDLTEVAYLSRSRLHAVFRKFFNRSPIDYIKTLRLEKAAQLLTTSGEPVSRIAEQLGFANQFHFSREFKAYFGQPPSKYRCSAYLFTP